MTSVLQPTTSSSLRQKAGATNRGISDTKQQLKLKSIKQVRFDGGPPRKSSVATGASGGKSVEFDLDKTSVQPVPSRSDYSFMELFRLYYKQKDYDSFERMYADKDSNSGISAKLMQRRSSSGEERPKLASLIAQRKSV